MIWATVQRKVCLLMPLIWLLWLGPQYRWEFVYLVHFWLLVAVTRATVQRQVCLFSHFCLAWPGHTVQRRVCLFSSLLVAVTRATVQRRVCLLSSLLVVVTQAIVQRRICLLRPPILLLWLRPQNRGGFVYVLSSLLVAVTRATVQRRVCLLSCCDSGHSADKDLFT